MWTMITAAIGLLGTLAGIAWKWKAANSASAADKAASAEATDANAATRASAAVTDNARAAAQKEIDANQSATSGLVERVGNDSVRAGADELNAAIAAANRSAH